MGLFFFVLWRQSYCVIDTGFLLTTRKLLARQVTLLPHKEIKNGESVQDRNVHRV